MISKKEYRKKIRNLFFISIKNDLEKWQPLNNVDFESPVYNNVQFRTDIYKWKYSYLNTVCLDPKVILTNGSSKITEQEIISRYKFAIIPLDIKIWWYIRKIKNHFKKLANDNKLENETQTLKFILENVESVFIKEVRKQKLNKINEN